MYVCVVADNVNVTIPLTIILNCSCCRPGEVLFISLKSNPKMFNWWLGILRFVCLLFLNGFYISFLKKFCEVDSKQMRVSTYPGKSADNSNDVLTKMFFKKCVQNFVLFIFSSKVNLYFWLTCFRLIKVF